MVMLVGPVMLMIAEAGKGSGTTGSASGRLLELSATGRTADSRYRPHCRQIVQKGTTGLEIYNCNVSP